MARYNNNNSSITQNPARNPHTAILMPTMEVEVENEKWEKSLRIVFDEQTIEEFKKVRSYAQFMDYCEANDLMVLF